MSAAPRGLSCSAAAQSVPQLTTNVRDLYADFLASSGHKMHAPTGIGVLYGREELQSRLLGRRSSGFNAKRPEAAAGGQYYQQPYERKGDPYGRIKPELADRQEIAAAQREQPQSGRSRGERQR